MTTPVTTLDPLAVAAQLKSDHPAHVRAISHGLALVLLGRVMPNLEGYFFFTVGQYTVNVISGDFSFAGWQCTCPQGRDYGQPVVGHFACHECRHLCKHIAAAAICWTSEVYPPKPASILEAVELMIAANEVPEPDRALVISAHKGGEIKLARRVNDGREVLVLQTGRTRSGTLARWSQDVTGPAAVGVWQLATDYQAIYAEFRAKVEKE